MVVYSPNEFNSHQVFVADDVVALQPINVSLLKVDLLNLRFLHEDHQPMQVGIPYKSVHCALDIYLIFFCFVCFDLYSMFRSKYSQFEIGFRANASATCVDFCRVFLCECVNV